MNFKHLLEWVDLLTLATCCFALVAMFFARQLSKYRSVAIFVASCVVMLAIQIPLLYHRRATGLTLPTAWKIFFFATESGDILQTGLTIAIIYGVFFEAMRPFRGLQHLGSMVFRWVSAVCVLLAAAFTLGPQMFAPSAQDPITTAISCLIQRTQEGFSLLTLCLLLFVCIAIKPLGLTVRSKVFGVALGLAVITVTNLVQAAWLYTTGARSVYSPIYLFGTIGYLSAFAIWGSYFVIEEPERKMVLVPTTSPFFHWNQVAEALGDPPGHVAVGFKPSMFAPQETLAFSLMGRYNRERREAAEAAAAAAAAANEVGETRESASVS